MRKLATWLVAFAVALTVFVVPAGAITNGQPDAGEHPYVGELIFFDADFIDPRFDDPGGWFSCSATMLSATVIVTAGHCTDGIGLDGESTTTGGGDGSGGNDIWFDFSEAAHFDGFPPSSDYGRDENDQRYEDRAAFLNASPFWHRGTNPHPEFTPDEFFLHDAGVVVLDESIAMSKYGRIPTLDYVDRYQGQPQHLFEVVGHGLTKSGPFTAEGGDTRLKGDVKLNTLKASPPDTFVLSNNPGKPHKGDVPAIRWTDVRRHELQLGRRGDVLRFQLDVLRVGGAYRLDQPDDLAFLASFGITPE